MSSARKLLLLVVLPAVILFGIIQIGLCTNKAEAEKEIEVSAPLDEGGVFTAETLNGSISVTGSEKLGCRVMAKIVAHAESDKEAKELAGKVKVRLIQDGKKLIARIDKPKLPHNRSLSVSLDVTVPTHTDIKLKTCNGNLQASNLSGKMNMNTINGSIGCTDISGGMRVETVNGSVKLDNVSGDSDVRAANGSIVAAYPKSFPGVFKTDIATVNGNINFIAPENLSVEIDLSTVNGKIKTQMPITVSGEISRNKLHGTIGKGEGKLSLETTNGSITIE